ncbi:MAG: hypothetical protein PHQ23_09290, partial [Candidatus Wallbacteria bacterium]|nr:hypothetical protein [Candidatus Wallbacteria bacterium]
PSPSIASVLVSAGGSGEAAEAVSTICRHLSEKKPEWEIHAVLPDGHRIPAGVIRHSFGTGFPELLAQCELFITAAGLSMYEAMYLGKPLIAFALVDHQHRNINHALASGSILKVLDRIADIEQFISMLAWFESPDKVSSMVRTNRQTIDGYGLKRVCNRLADFFA